MAANPVKSFTEVPCPAYELKVPGSQDPFGVYSFGMHRIHKLPWDIFIGHDGILLKSHTCFGTTTLRPGDSADNPPPCVNCRSLHNNTMLIGIRHRFLDGIHQNVNYPYYSVNQLEHLLHYKNQQIDTLKLRSLSSAHALTSCNRVIGGWKCLAMAISTNHIPRLKSLFAVEIENGAGVFGLLHKVDQASRLVYHAKSYEEADYQCAFLLWKLGGRSAAQIANRTLGTPSIDTARRYIATVPIVASPGFLKMSEIKHNLGVVLGELEGNLREPVMGAKIETDEIKNAERLRWNAHTDEILGTCREHGDEHEKMFKSLAQADAILERLHSREVHLSEEVRSVDIPVYSPCSLYSRLLLLLCQCSLKTPSGIQRAHTSSRGLANGKMYPTSAVSF